MIGLWVGLLEAPFAWGEREDGGRGQEEAGGKTIPLSKTCQKYARNLTFGI